MSSCNRCGAQNRPSARFCKRCGAPVERQVSREGYYGKECIESELRRFQERLKLAVHLKKSGTGTRVGLDSLILGPQGSGKKFIARGITDMAVSAGIVDPEKVVEVDAADYDNWSENLDETLSKISDGALIITNVHKILCGAKSSEITSLDSLFVRMAKETSELPVVIMTGLYNDMESFLSGNIGVADLFEFRFRLFNIDEDVLASLTACILKERFKMNMTADAVTKLKGHYEWMVRMGKGTSGNGHLAFSKAEELATNMFNRSGRDTITSDDVKGEVFVPRSEKEIWDELRDIIGLDSVKNEVRKIIDGLHLAQEEQGPEARITIRDHYVFTGNPGTGKTTIARKFAEILAAVGALPKGQYIETDASKLIGQFIGDTEKNVRDAVDKAMGGVLFIDEAYGLANGQYGQAAINTLVPLLENHKGEFVCIVAGYKREMNDFMKTNTGLSSRFNKPVDFPDYTPEELEKIFLLFADKAGFALNDEAKEKLHIPMERMYNRRTEQFGNGRDVRNFFDLAIERRGRRILSMDAAARKIEGRLLTYEDIVGEDGTKEISVNEVLAQLDDLVGLDEVKRFLKLQAANIVQEQRKALRKGSLPYVPKDHYMFLGNPGTGKTTVARMMGKILKSLGILATDEVTEVGRKQLVGRFQGDTAPMTTDTVMRAMGGILFIDEAYTLVNGEGDTFGRECVDTLVPLLENNKGKFVCIVAGYTEAMKSFLSANDGLQSRFSKKIIFEDYTPEQLTEIFRRIAAKNEFRLDPEADTRAQEAFQEIYANRDSRFGNARDVGNLFEHVRNCHNMRLLYSESSSSEEQDCTITLQDMEEGYEEMKRMCL